MDLVVKKIIDDLLQSFEQTVLIFFDTLASEATSDILYAYNSLAKIKKKSV